MSGHPLSGARVRPFRAPRRRFAHGRNASVPILAKERDPRLITVRRGGTLTDGHLRLSRPSTLHKLGPRNGRGSRCTGEPHPAFGLLRTVDTFSSSTPSQRATHDSVGGCTGQVKYQGSQFRSSGQWSPPTARLHPTAKDTNECRSRSPGPGVVPTERRLAKRRAGDALERGRQDLTTHARAHSAGPTRRRGSSSGVTCRAN